MAAGAKTGGRKTGTPNKATAEIRLAAQEYTAEALETLASVMRNSQSDQARVAAAKDLLDRGHGKSKTAIEHSGGLTLEQLILASYES